jgi:putative Holliday junction resolvase
MRILAVDPGEVRIGLAISDPSGTIARPLEVIPHHSRDQDAAKIVEIASQQGAQRIVVGLAVDPEGRLGSQARKALRLVTTLTQSTGITVETWDESFSTQRAESIRTGDPDLDARAAAFILQDYLDAHNA